MKDLLFLLFLQIIVSCNSSNNINDMVQSTLFFIPADTLRTFSGNGSFAVVGDTVVISDYYYDYNDGKEFSLFKLNVKGNKRVLTHRNNGTAEISTDKNKIQTLWRSYNSQYEEYDLKELASYKDSCLYKLSFIHTDHIVKTKDHFVGSDIVGSPHILNLYDKQGKLQQSIDPFNGTLDKLSEIGQKYAVGQGYLAYNSEDDYVVYATVYTGEIFIYKIEDNKLRLIKHIEIGYGLPENYTNFKVRNNTMMYAKDICTSRCDTYILIDNKAAGDNSKISYILRINKQGDVYVMKCYQSLLRIDVEKQKLYALAKGEDGKNVLVVANLDRSNTAN